MSIPAIALRSTVSISPPPNKVEKPSEESTGGTLKMVIPFSMVPAVIQEISSPWDFDFKQGSVMLSLPNKPEIKSRIDGILERLNHTTQP